MYRMKTEMRKTKLLSNKLTGQKVSGRIQPADIEDAQILPLVSPAIKGNQMTVGSGSIDFSDEEITFPNTRPPHTCTSKEIKQAEVSRYSPKKVRKSVPTFKTADSFYSTMHQWSQANVSTDYSKLKPLKRVERPFVSRSTLYKPRTPKIGDSDIQHLIK